MPSIFRKGLFDGQISLVTGGGSGIGLAVAHTLGELGAKVAICGRNPEKLAKAEKDLRDAGVAVFSAPCDIREPEQVAALVGAVKNEFGDISVLVNNAGGQFPTAAEALSPRGFDAVIRNNLSGTFYMTREVATKCMIPHKRGRIVNVLANIRRGFPMMMHTGAARAGVENMTKTLAIEWATYNLQINSVAPGIIGTEGIQQYGVDLVELSRRRTPMRRVGTAEEVAELVAYLASEAAAFVTGETWYIDGGANLWGDTWPIPDEPHPLPETVRKLSRQKP